jgi:hemerythrin-like domain-containing protein
VNAGVIMSPTRVLQGEHRIICEVLTAAEREAQEMSCRGAFDTAVLGGMMDFLQHFLHGCHHIREERYLFVSLQRRIRPAEQISLVPLLRAHDECRRRLNAIAALLLPAIREDYWTVVTLADQLTTYCEQMRAHIEQEEQVMFPLAEAVLRPADRKDLLEQFRMLTLREMGLETYRKYCRLARELSRPMSRSSVGMEMAAALVG